MGATNLRLLSAALLCIISAGRGMPVEAAPQGGNVVAGQAGIQQPDATTTVVTQASPSLVIDWNSFNVDSAERVQFKQPDAAAAVLNRIGDARPSQIDGALSANGRVFLINPNGMIFGDSAVVNVGSLVAGSLGIANEDFMRGDYRFSAAPGQEGGRVVNHGLLSAAVGGSVTLLGGSVANDGLIVANYGQVNLGAGHKVLLDFDGDGLLRFEVPEPVLSNGQGVTAAVANSGSIVAPGGRVVLTASAAKDVFTRAVNNSGVIQAVGVDKRGGVVRLVGIGGDVYNSGTLDASSTSGQGGNIDVLGDRVALAGNARINASGSAGGGSVRIGGDSHGDNPEVQNASQTYVGPDVAINADAQNQGDGGRVVVWGDDTARIYGDISAKGGAASGNGGFVETSGKRVFDISATPDVSAPNGKGGEWLIDPNNIDIVSGGGAINISSTNPFATTDDSAQLDVALIQAALTGGANVTITTGTAGANTQDGDITFTANLDFSAKGTNSLSLIAADDIIISGQISATTPVAGDMLNLTLDASNGNTADGDNVQINNTIDLNGGNLTINAAGAINQTAGNLAVAAASINAGAGSINLTQAANDFTGAVSLNNSGANNVAITDANALNLGASSVGTGTLTVNGVGITQSGTLTQAAAAGAATFNGGAGVITLTDASNDFTGAVSLNNSGANNVAITDGNALNLGASSVGTGTLTVNGVGITQSGTLTQAALAGAATFIGGAGVITLSNAGNDFTGPVSLTNSGANAAALVDQNALTLGALSLGGDLTVTSTGALNLGQGAVGGDLAATSSGGAVTQSGALSVTGTTSVAAGTNTIDLATNGTSNDFTGAVSLNNSGANNVAITDANALNLGTSSVGTGTLTVNGVGITQSGTLTQAALAGAATFNGGAGVITLSNVSNDFRGPVLLSNSGANAIVVANANALVLGTSTVGGNLDVVSGGAITQSGALSVAGTSSFNAGANAITLTDATNDFTGSVSLNNSGANNVALTDVNALDLGTSTVGGALYVVSGGPLTQSGALSLAGTSSFNAGANTITLADGANDFTGAVSLTNSGANNVAIIDANALDLGASTVGGNLDVVSNGAITQSGALSVAKATTLSAGAANDITLGDVTNTLSSVGITTGNNVTLRDAGGLAVMPSTVSGTLDVGSGGAITLTGPINVSSLVLASVGAVSGTGTVTGTGTSSVSGITDYNAALHQSGGVTYNGFTTIGGVGKLSNVTNYDLVTGSDGVGVTYSGFLTLSGAGGGTLSSGTAWNISGTDSGTVDGYTFSNFRNLTGDSANDVFSLSGGGILSGVINGGAGTNTLTADDVANAWTIAGTDSGTVTGVSGGFNHIQILVGGAGNDAFAMGAGGVVSGAVDGGEGADTLDYHNYSGDVVVDLGRNSATGIGGIANIETVIGGMGGNTLVGPNVATNWMVLGPDTLTTNGGLNFLGFHTLQGGTDADFYDIGADFTGSIDGGDGTDTININAPVHTANLDLAADEVNFNAPGQINAGGGVVTITAGAVNADQRDVHIIADSLVLHATDYAGTYNIPLGLQISNTTDFGAGTRNFVSGYFGATQGDFIDVGKTTLNIYRGQSAVVQDRGRIDPALFIKDFNLFTLIDGGVRLTPDQREE